MDKSKVEEKIDALRAGMNNCGNCKGVNMVLTVEGYQWCGPCSRRVEQIDKLYSHMRVGPDPLKALAENRERLRLAQEELIDARSSLHHLYSDILKTNGYKPRDIAISDAWNCEDSPVGRCLYDKYQDPSHSKCLICNEPENRK